MFRFSRTWQQQKQQRQIVVATLALPIPFFRASIASYGECRLRFDKLTDTITCSTTHKQTLQGKQIQSCYDSISVINTGKSVLTCSNIEITSCQNSQRSAPPYATYMCACMEWSQRWAPLALSPLSIGTSTPASALRPERIDFSRRIGFRAVRTICERQEEAAGPQCIQHTHTRRPRMNNRKRHNPFPLSIYGA